MMAHECIYARDALSSSDTGLVDKVLQRYDLNETRNKYLDPKPNVLVAVLARILHLLRLF